MSISATIASGLQGMQAGIYRTDAAGSRIAGLGLNTDSGYVAASMGDQMQGANQVKLSADVVKAGNEVLGTLIDMMA
jgi:hypothetical protein